MPNDGGILKPRGLREQEIRRKALALREAGPEAGTPLRHPLCINPVQLAEQCGVRVQFADLGSLNGLYTVLNHVPYIVLSLRLNEEKTALICAHELGHHILHRSLACGRVLSDYDLFQRDSRTEFEANCFACHLLIDEEELTAQLCRPDVSCLTVASLAHSLNLTPELLSLKLALAGFPVEAPSSGFLRR